MDDYHNAVDAISQPGHFMQNAREVLGLGTALMADALAGIVLGQEDALALRTLNAALAVELRRSSRSLSSPDLLRLCAELVALEGADGYSEVYLHAGVSLRPANSTPIRVPEIPTDFSDELDNVDPFLLDDDRRRVWGAHYLAARSEAR
jgi:hypothetical protein